MLKRYGMTEANTSTTPADVKVKLVKNDNVSKEVDPVLYKSIDASLFTLLWLHVLILPMQWELCPSLMQITLYSSKENFEVLKGNY